MASINDFVTKKYFTSMKQKFTFYVLYHTTNNHFETLDPSRIPTKLLFSQQVLEVKAWYSCHNTSAIILLQQQMQNSRLHPNLIPFQVMSHPLSREVLENPVELIINFCKIYTYIKKPQKSYWTRLQRSHCLKITQNVAFEFWHFQPSFCLVTLFDRKLQVFKNSPKWTIFWHF